MFLADKEEVEFIGDLIMGGGPSKAKQGKCAFLFDIVSNSRNSVDVDKFDYLQRDAYNVGIKSTCACFITIRRCSKFCFVDPSQV